MNRFCPDAGGEALVPVGVLHVHILCFAEQLTIREIGQARFDHHIGFKIQNAFQFAQGHIQHQANARRQRFQKPDMRHRRREFDMGHTLAPFFLQGHLHPAFFTGNPAIFHTLIFAAQTLVILDGAKNTRTK